MEFVRQGKQSEFVVSDEILCCGSRFCVPNVAKLKKEILQEVHSSGYFVHLSRPRCIRIFMSSFDVLV